MMSEYNRKYVDISNYDTRKTSFMSIKDRSSSRFQNGGNSEDYEIRNIYMYIVSSLLFTLRFVLSFEMQQDSFCILNIPYLS